jgi:hypothetical protein
LKGIRAVELHRGQMQGSRINIDEQNQSVKGGRFAATPAPDQFPIIARHAFHSPSVNSNAMGTEIDEVPEARKSTLESSRS